jgi:PhnB protein
MPRITPYLYYEDVSAALDWLSRSFGFRERMRMPGPDGAVMHAEMELADGVIMLGHPGTEYRSPRRLGQSTHSLCVYVDDVGKRFQHARRTRAPDLEGPRTSSTATGARSRGSGRAAVVLRQHVRDVAPEDMKP